MQKLGRNQPDHKKTTFAGFRVGFAAVAVSSVAAIYDYEIVLYHEQQKAAFLQSKRSKTASESGHIAITKMRKSTPVMQKITVILHVQFCLISKTGRQWQRHQGVCIYSIDMLQFLHRNSFIPNKW